MFERIFDWIDRGWSHLKPFFVVDVYEKAGILRLGKFQRAVEPGFHWKIPFFDHVVEITACVTTVRLPAQYLTTKDGKQVALKSIIRYQIRDIEPYICGIFDQHDVLCDVTMGAIRRRIAEADYDALVANPPEAQVRTDIRRSTGKYGFEIHDVTFTSFTKARPIMLITESVLKDLDN